MAAISFFNEDADFTPENSGTLQQWIMNVVTGEGKTPGELNFIFCSDEYLHEINVSYLAHDNYTDIITFDNAEDPEMIEGDIFISIPRVRENALKYDTGFRHELHRVIIHGVLHLLGYQDKTESEKKRMRAKEDHCLSLGPEQQPDTI